MCLTNLAIALFALLVAKHYLADFQFQTTYHAINKGRYLHIGGLQHAGIHGALTFVIVWLWFGWATGLFFGLLDAAIHYHIDFAKATISRKMGLTTDNPFFWKLLGLDQTAHMLSYVALVYLLLVR